MQPKESLDLMNVDYEDVLHLYRGWRKSEATLKDKDKELIATKEKFKQMQDDLGKFRNKLQALESFKELTITLQNQLSQVQHENQRLVAENEELAKLNLNAEELLRKKDKDIVDQARALKDVQLEFATLKGRYEESMKAHRELERLAAEEQALRMSLESRLNTVDQSMDDVREENRSLRQKLETANVKLAQCDQELLHASEQLSSISREVVSISTTKEALEFAESEVGVLKGDISRLLRLLEKSNATKEFLAHWKDSGGMNFVGIDREPSSVNRSGSTLQSNDMFSRTGLPLSEGDLHDFHHHSHQHHDSMMSKFDLTPMEFNHLKEVHGNDPYPMTSNLVEESEYWVPADAAKLGVQFMASKFPNTPPRVILDFLRNMNKIWLRRERRKVKRVKEVLGSQIEDLKRQIQAMKPYKGVIAERQIRRLKTQVKQGLMKSLKGRPRGRLEQSALDEEKFEEVDFEYSSLPHERRPCRMSQRSAHFGDGDVTRVSQEKLLEASLQSLDTVTRRLAQTSSSSSHFMAQNDDDIVSRPYHPSHSDSEGFGTASSKSYPNTSYLRGALWLGRNLTLLIEEMTEAMDKYRGSFLAEVADAGNDPDARRACHRLTILAGAGVNQCCNFTTKARDTTRELLQGAAALEPGNTAQYQRYLGNLPIESTLADGGKSGIQLISEQRQKLFQTSGGRSGTPPPGSTFRRPLSAPSSSLSTYTSQRPSSQSQQQHQQQHSPLRQFQQQMRHSSLLDSPLHPGDLTMNRNTSFLS